MGNFLKLIEDVKNYIDENFSEDFYEDINLSYKSSIQRGEELGDMLENLDSSFSETLLELIDKSGKSEPEIYKKAMVDRRLFSKIKNNKYYRPSKKTIIAFALALELDLENTNKLLERSGFTLSHSEKFDVIIEYFIINKEYDIFEINEVLLHFDQPLIGY